MIEDYSINQIEKKGKDRRVYIKGQELTMSVKEAKRLVKLGVAEKLDAPKPNRTPITL